LIKSRKILRSQDFVAKNAGKTQDMGAKNFVAFSQNIFENFVENT
jgi:hypothetical protein